MEHVTEDSFPHEAVSSCRTGVSCINTRTGLGLWIQTTWTLNIFIRKLAVKSPK